MHVNILVNTGRRLSLSHVLHVNNSKLVHTCNSTYLRYTCSGTVLDLRNVKIKTGLPYLWCTVQRYTESQVKNKMKHVKWSRSSCKVLYKPIGKNDLFCLGSFELFLTISLTSLISNSSNFKALYWNITHTEKWQIFRCKARWLLTNKYSRANSILSVVYILQPPTH